VSFVYFRLNTVSSSNIRSCSFSEYGFDIFVKATSYIAQRLYYLHRHLFDI